MPPAGSSPASRDRKVRPLAGLSCGCAPHTNSAGKHEEGSRDSTIRGQGAPLKAPSARKQGLISNGLKTSREEAKHRGADPRPSSLSLSRSHAAVDFIRFHVECQP